MFYISVDKGDMFFNGSALNKAMMDILGLREDDSRVFIYKKNLYANKVVLEGGRASFIARIS